MTQAKDNNSKKSFGLILDMNSSIFGSLRGYPFNIPPVAKALPRRLDFSETKGGFKLLVAHGNVFDAKSLSVAGRLLNHKFINIDKLTEKNFKTLVRNFSKNGDMWILNHHEAQAYLNRINLFAISALTAINICHEFSLLTGDFQKDKELALLNIANLDIPKCFEQALEARTDDRITRLNMEVERLITNFTNLEQRDTPSVLQALVIKSLIAVNKAYITALTKKYGLDKPQHPIDSLDWIEWHPLKVRLDLIPTVTHSDGVYCKLEDVASAIADYAQTDLVRLLGVQNAHIEEHTNIIKRIMYIHNFPHLLVDREGYMKKKLESPYYTSELFDLYLCSQEGFMGLMRSMPRELESYPYKYDLDAYAYIYKRSPEIKGYLKEMAMLLDWDIEAAELEESVKRKIEHHLQEKKRQRQHSSH